MSVYPGNPRASGASGTKSLRDFGTSRPLKIPEILKSQLPLRTGIPWEASSRFTSPTV